MSARLLAVGQGYRVVMLRQGTRGEPDLCGGRVRESENSDHDRMNLRCHYDSR